jgi:hypothetical protein
MPILRHAITAKIPTLKPQDGHFTFMVLQSQLKITLTRNSLGILKERLKPYLQ